MDLRNSMYDDTITFQLATHYLSKIALRLERLFFAIGQACHETHPIIHHYALKNIIEIIKLVEKPELKSRFLKELMRLEHVLNKSPEALSNALYAELYVQIQILIQIAGGFGDNLPNNPFLHSIRLAQSSHESDCELHAPQLFLWLEGDAVRRQDDLLSWLEKLRTLDDTVHIYLSLLRETARYETIDLQHGFYQSPLPSKILCHLILVKIDKRCGMVPLMQLGHHGLSIRLCDALSMKEMHHSNANIELALCQL